MCFLVCIYILIISNTQHIYVTNLQTENYNLVHSIYHQSFWKMIKINNINCILKKLLYVDYDKFYDEFNSATFPDRRYQ